MSERLNFANTRLGKKKRKEEKEEQQTTTETKRKREIYSTPNNQIFPDIYCFYVNIDALIRKTEGSIRSVFIRMRVFTIDPGTKVHNHCSCSGTTVFSC